MISSILGIVSQIIAVVTALVLAVERPSEGAEKKAEVIAGLKLALAVLPIPAWAKLLFINDTILGVIVDVLVFALNKTGWFKTGAVPDPTG